MCSTTERSLPMGHRPPSSAYPRWWKPISVTAPRSGESRERVMLEVSNLHVGYGAMPVLRGIDLSVMANEIVAVLGSNGAGKTTLNRALSGLIVPTTGRIRWFGTSIAGVDPA